MKIAIILSRVPWPLEKGDKLRAFHQIRELAACHEIHLVAVSDEPMHPEAEKELKKYVRTLTVHFLTKPGILWQLLKGIFSALPFQCSYFLNAAINKRLNQKLDAISPDIVYCQLVRMSEYVKHRKGKKILDYMDSFSSGMERRKSIARFPLSFIYSQETLRLKRYEEEIHPYFDACTVIAERDRKLLGLSGLEKVTIVPNGVDVDFFSPVNGKKNYDLGFTGNLSYPPNRDAAEYLIREIYPEIKRNSPTLSLMVAGANPPQKLRSLATETITVQGWTPDLRLVYDAVRVFVAPFRLGSGLQNKILEAMAMGIPCVVSPLVNESLCAVPGTHLLVASTREEFVQSISRLLKDETFQKKLGHQGAEWVKENFSWKESMKKLEMIF